jgi:hypothetical protein
VREFQPESPGIWALNCRESRRFSAKKSRDSLPGEAENLRVENSRPTCLDYSMEAGLLFYQGRIVVPDNEDLRRDLIAAFHDSPIAGHLGQQRTLELISR